MDGARMRRRTSSPPQLPSTDFFSLSRSNTFDDVVENDVCEPDASPSRKQKFLNNRNARFPGKRLSLTGISNKFNQLIGKNEQASNTAAPSRDQENSTLHKSKSTGTIGKRGSLGILNEHTYSGKSHSLRRREEIPIFQDHIEKTGRSSPFVSSPYIDPQGGFNSPLAFDSIHDDLNEMRLRELSLNVDWSPIVRSPSLHSKSQKRSSLIPFDTDGYIEHIEKELQQTRDEAYSPLTRRPVREKLKAANKENERLQKELAQLRERFETEVKKTVEHKTLAELELRRKVRDLEELLEDKDHTIRELQYQHEERRLDNNTITSLKASIDRLEQEKIDMEQINLSMSKRNEVLTQLLAMSPTKLSDGFHLRSPVREKRNARPISLILPRQAASPNSNLYANPSSTVGSPRAIDSANISPFKLSPDQDFPLSSSGVLQIASTTPQKELADPVTKVPSPEHRTRSRRSTLQSDISTSSASNNGIGFFPTDERHTRRKARRFMGGSTQLKPLLLPSIAGEGMTLSSASTASSPRSWKARPYSDVDVDETILADDKPLDSTLPETAHKSLIVITDGPGPALPSQSETRLSDHQPPQLPYLTAPAIMGHAELNASISHSLDVSPSFSNVPAPGTELSVEHLKIHDSQYSLHKMPAPDTPESLINRPQPLFSSHRKISSDAARLHSASPHMPSEVWQVSVQKKRKNSFGTHDIFSPAPKIQCSRQLHDPCANMDSPQISRPPSPCSPAIPANKRLSQIRTTDNFVDLLRQKNFAARPLAALTIRTVYALLSTCTSAVRDFQKDPFALARDMLANAWRANWKVFGKVSWWVLGLFIQPETKSRARAPIDWDQYDGESIASRYCSSTSQNSDLDDAPSEEDVDNVSSEVQNSQNCDGKPITNVTDSKVGWGSSMYLWGKFSAALMLAVGGAVVRGPGEMLKETNADENRKKRRSKSCKSCPRRAQDDEKALVHSKTPQSRGTQRQRMASLEPDIVDSPYTSDFDFRCQPGGSSILDQIQQPDYDSTLRPETATRGRLGSLFSPTPSPGELVTRLEELRLSSSDWDDHAPQVQKRLNPSMRDGG